MKTIDLRELYRMALHMKFDEFEQELKVYFSGRPSTEVIEKVLLLVDWADVSDLKHQLDEAIMGENF